MAKLVPWFLIVLAAVILLTNILYAVQRQSMVVSTATIDFWVDTNGDARVNTVHPPIRPVLANVVFRVQEHESALGRDVWERCDWSIDIQPISGQPTAQQRRQIIEQMFAEWTTSSCLKGRAPPEAVSGVPAAGTTVVSGSDFALHRWGFVRGVVAGWPTGLALFAGFIAWMIWMTPKGPPREVDRTVCAGCGYSRAGLGEGAACPECGRRGPV